MTKTWMEGDFSIQSVAKESGWHLGTEGSRRLFAARLIHRYAYVVGTQKAFYWSLKNPANVKEALQGLRQVSTPEILASASQHDSDTLGAVASLPLAFPCHPPCTVVGHRTASSSDLLKR